MEVYQERLLRIAGYKLTPFSSGGVHTGLRKVWNKGGHFFPSWNGESSAVFDSMDELEKRLLPTFRECFGIYIEKYEFKEGSDIIHCTLWGNLIPNVSLAGHGKSKIEALNDALKQLIDTPFVATLMEGWCL